MSQLSAIKDRRRAITNLRKVTHAMELVTKTKIAKVRNNAKNARNYQQAFEDLAALVLGALTPRSKTTQTPVRYVVGFFSQKGFCGNFNDKLMHKLSFTARNLEPQHLYLIGKATSKWAYVLKRQFLHIEAKEKTYQEELRPLITVWQKVLAEQQPVEIYLVYNKFNSILDQQPTVEMIYPLSAEKTKKTELLYEPDLEKLAAQLLVAYLDACVEKVYWESVAGEYCSRLLSMKNANDNAAIIIDKLNLEYNKTRQSKITQELSEVVSAFDVLKLVQEKKKREEE